MTYKEHVAGDYVVIALSGEVDLYQSPQARQQILAVLNNSRPLLVDLSAVEYIDSSGIASLVEGYQLAKSKQLQFALVGVSESAMRVLKLARLDTVFPMHVSLADVVPGGTQ